MVTPLWLQRLRSTLTRRQTTRSRRKTLPRARPCIEVLEDRVVPSGFTEFPVPTPSSYPVGITVGADGNLWFTERNADKIGRISPAGNINEFPEAAANTRLWGLTAGPDGNVWFGLEGDGVPSQVGRITPAGAITLFPILPAYSYPDMTSGPDGNLWVTEATNNEIARVSPQGVLLSQFTIPVPGGNPEFITAGPDGKLWFSEIQRIDGQEFQGPLGAAYVGRVSVDGTFTMFAIPGTPNNVKGITTGPDGNIWFAEQYANKIGRITTSGVMTEFAIPTPNSVPTVIMTGPDGNLWFTEDGGVSQIASITPSGVIMEYPIPTPDSVPVQIVIGPDGNLWFTEANANQVGRFTPGQQGPYVVTTTADSGPGSLREAINDIDADTNHTVWASPSNPNVDEIDFNITAASDTGGGYDATTGVATITPQGGLPTIANAVIIDGYTQADASPNTLSQGDNAVLKIQLNLSDITPVYNVGLRVNADNSTIRGLVVNDLATTDHSAIYVTGTGDRVEGNFIGTNPTGTQPVGNPRGIGLDGASDLVIGGMTAAARNLISGNGWGITGAGTGIHVEGNYIGTDHKGKTAIGNTIGGIHVNGDYTIGGTTLGDGNLISGNPTGIVTDGAPSTVIQGNLIGTDVTGTSALGNVYGIDIETSHVLVGGTTPAARNLISGNGYGIFDNGGPLALIEGNYIGTDITGMQGLGTPQAAGIYLFGQGATIGGLTGTPGTGAGNVIEGNNWGIGALSGGNGYVVQGNLITGNSQGAVNLAFGSSNNTIGGADARAGNFISGGGTGILITGSGNLVEGNVISGNNGDGVQVDGGTGNSILGNSIHDNGGLGIDLVNGANNNQVAPVLTAAISSGTGTAIFGTLATYPGTSFRIEFFSNPTGAAGEGQTFLGSFAPIITGPHGEFSANLSTSLPLGTFLSATATDAAGNTSGFAADITVVTLGADPSGTGGETVAFWDNKGNKTLITAADLSSLDALNLVNQAGNAFDPSKVQQLQAWLSTSPNATTPYQLAVQLAAMDLNVLAGYVHQLDLVYAGALLPYATTYSIAGLTSGGFIDIQDLMNAANAELGLDPNAVTGQAYQAALAQVLQAANANSNFVQ